MSVRAVVAAAWLMPGTWVMVAATCRRAAAACSGVVMSHPTRQPVMAWALETAPMVVMFARCPGAAAAAGTWAWSKVSWEYTSSATR